MVSKSIGKYYATNTDLESIISFWPAISGFGFLGFDSDRLLLAGTNH